MDVRKTAAVFKALGDENRIRILKMLRDGEKCACKLLEELNISQPTLSHHMKILCDAEIVTGRREGKWMHYCICCDGAKNVRAALRELLSPDDTPANAAVKRNKPYTDAAFQKGIDRMKKIAFICVHNSCRSQIAEALGKHLRGGEFQFYSAGTETKPQINRDAVRLVKQLYGIDMEATQYSKLLSDIPEVDIVITMGCNVQCPYLPCSHREDWGLEDPTGKPDAAFLEVIQKIHERIMKL